MGTSSLSNGDLDRLSEVGHTIYNEKLKSLLEPRCNGQEVAIHLETGDYEVARRSARPTVALRKRHLEGGMIMSMVVGAPEPEDTLASRMLMSQAHPQRIK